MPPRGVEPGTKRARQYEHIKDSEKEQGASESRAEEIAARTVTKERALRRVAFAVAHLGAGQVLFPARRGALRCPRQRERAACAWRR
jgi:hypothetical protein